MNNKTVCFTSSNFAILFTFPLGGFVECFCHPAKEGLSPLALSSIKEVVVAGMEVSKVFVRGTRRGKEVVCGAMSRRM